MHELTTTILLQQLRELGVTLELLPDSKLSVRAPADALSDTMRAAIAEHKEHLVRLLASARAPAFGW